MATFNDPRFYKPANQWTLEDLDAWQEVENAQREPVEVDTTQLDAWDRERQAQYEAWKQELAELQTDKEGDENISYRIQCLQADIFSYEEAKAAIERGDEYMAENPYERGLTN